MSEQHHKYVKDHPTEQVSSPLAAKPPGNQGHTPETDAAEIFAEKKWWFSSTVSNGGFVTKEFAKRLEAERDRLRQSLGYLLSAAILVSDALHNEEQQGAQLKASTDTAWEKLSFAIEACRAQP